MLAAVGVPAQETATDAAGPTFRRHPYDRVMFLFIGVFPREREIAVATFRCDHCHEEAAQRIIESGSRLWVLFVPLFTFGRQYVMVCSHCGRATEVSRELAMRVADLARQSGPR